MTMAAPLNTEINVLEFIEQIGKTAPAPVIVLCPFKAPRAQNATFEPLLASRAVEALVNFYVDPSLKDLTYSSFFADETSPAEIVSVAQTYPFLAERRVVVVHNAEKFPSEARLKPLIAYLEAPCETTLLIMVTSKIDKRSRLYKACEKSSLFVTCPELKPAEAVTWVKKEAAARGKELDSAAAQQLVERGGARLSDVNNALTLVCEYVGAKTQIREVDVIAATADVAEEQIWALTDAIARSDTANAIRVLRQMYELGKSEFEIMGTINWLLKTAYTAAVAPPDDPRLRLFQFQKAQPLVQKLGVARLRRAFGLIVDTDFLMRSTGVDRSLALELMVIKLAAPGPGSRRASA